MSYAGVAKKRSDALVVIAGSAVATGLAGAAPTPFVEPVKQWAIAASDVVMCLNIGKIYFQDRLTDWGLRETLHAFSAVGVGALLIYGGVKLADGLLAEFMNLAGPGGWLVSAATTGGTTLAVGLLFCTACDRAMRHNRDVGDELAALRRELAAWIQGDGPKPQALHDVVNGEVQPANRLSAPRMKDRAGRPVSPARRLTVPRGA